MEYYLTSHTKIFKIYLLQIKAETVQLDDLEYIFNDFSSALFYAKSYQESIAIAEAAIYLSEKNNPDKKNQLIYLLLLQCADAYESLSSYQLAIDMLLRAETLVRSFTKVNTK